MDLVPLKKHSLTRAQFEQLADIPLEEEWLANITNLKTRRAYKEDVREFVAFTALRDDMRLRSAARSHIIAWRKDMEGCEQFGEWLGNKDMALTPSGQE
jgi:hypothetical protein